MTGRLVLRIAAVAVGVTLARALLNRGFDVVDLAVLGTCLVCGVFGWWTDRQDRRDGRG